MTERPDIAEAFRTEGPLTRLQRWSLAISGISGWRRHVAALLLGALAAMALPPFDLPPVLLVSCVGLVWLADGNAGARQAFALGWWFGLGFFVAGLYWLAAALFVDIERFWWLVPFAVLGVPAGLAIFTGAATLASHVLCMRLGLAGVARILALAVAWSAAEYLRGHVLSGFPWNLIGQAWAGGVPGGAAMLQTAAYGGIYTLSLLTFLVAALPARLGDLTGGRRVPALAAAVILVAMGGLGALRLADDTGATVPGMTLRLVQPAIPQRLDNDPAAAAANFRRLLALTRSTAATPPRIVVWPEGMAPPFLERNEAARRLIGAALPAGAIALVGTVRTDPPPLEPRHVWNSLEAIDGAGTVVAFYDKAHLVPFGEYVPLRDILPLDKITPGSTDFSAGAGPRTITLAGIPPFSPLICYEAIFPDAVTDPLHRPAWLLNITNDAWYGYSSGPFQHLAIARVRAVEEGLPLVRDANNGISAVFDAYGRAVAHLDLDTLGVLDVALPAALPATLYARLGDWCYAGILLVLLTLAVSLGRRQRTPRQAPSG